MGKKKQHTLKSQIAVDSDTGRIVDVSDSVPGHTADIKLLETSGLLERLPDQVGMGGDLAYLKLVKLRRYGFAPRRKPHGKDRPTQDVIYNRAFSQFRIVIEQAIGQVRRFQSVTATDRNHRRHHGSRVAAVAGLVNRLPRFARA